MRRNEKMRKGSACVFVCLLRFGSFLSSRFREGSVADRTGGEGEGEERVEQKNAKKKRHYNLR